MEFGLPFSFAYFVHVVFDFGIVLLGDVFHLVDVLDVGLAAVVFVCA